jgi:RES domain-containing protein
MLRGLAEVQIDERIYRLGNPPSTRAALLELGDDWEAVVETVDFLKADSDDDALVLLNSPFVQRPGYKPEPTRFSDGTWRVFYSALEANTCEAEVAYWCRKTVQSHPATQRRFYYRQLRCRLRGRGYDVRPKVDEWAFLTGDSSSYPDCHKLAQEARDVQADAMLCPSARQEGGSTSPVFERHVLSDESLHELVSILIEVDGSVRVDRA